MIDNFAIGVTHVLILIGIWRLLSRTDLDTEPLAAPEAGSENDAPARPGRRAMRVRRV